MNRSAEGLERFFSVPPEEGTDKVVSLRKAIASNVRPGMSLFLVSTHTRPGALSYELIRRFGGKDPRFTLASVGFTGSMVALLHAGLAARVLASFCGDSYPSPGPNPIIQRAYESNRVRFDQWSILTIIQRVIAGAMGVEYFPTRSLRGSSMAIDNAPDYTEVRPHDDAPPVGLVRALKPDLALLHAAAADRFGNTILTPPYGTDVHAAFAAKEGAIVTVEKIVPTSFIRKQAHLARLPGSVVRAVAVAPFGSHPGGLTETGIEGFGGYADDYDFVEEIRKASKSPEAMDRWMAEWVTGPADPEAYLAKLGKERVALLKRKADPEGWREELRALPLGEMAERPANSIERMAVEGAREIERRVRGGGHRMILAGIGTSNLAAWLATYRLKESGVDLELAAEVGFYGYLPRPGDPFIFNLRNVPTCKSLWGIEFTMGVLMGGGENRTLGSIGAGQVDRHGNLNTTWVPGKTYLTGSGGGNDICSAAREVVVVVPMGPKRFIEKLPYVTSPGEHVVSVVTDLGVFEKRRGELVFARAIVPEGESMESIAREAVDRCGWALKVADDLAVADPIPPDDLLLLRLFDPKGQFLSR